MRKISRLIRLLDDDSTQVAGDAEDELVAVGIKVAKPLAAAVRSLERSGQLSAIRVFARLGAPGAGPA